MGNELSLIDGKSTYDDISNFLNAFLKLEPSDKEEILSMKSFEGPLDNNIEALITTRIKENFPTLSESDVRKLLSIVETNCHQYYGTNEDKVSIDVNQKHPSLTQSALFAVGSKATHSCDPNCVYTSKLGPFLAYRALKPIQIGELITFSYIADRLITPRIDRRCALLKTKHFVCQCVRCVGIDDNRGFKCKITKCRGIMYENDKFQWSCQTCKKTFSKNDVKESLAHEEKLKEKFNSFEKSLLLNATLSKVKPDDFESLVREISTKLSPTHYLVARTYQYYVRWLAGQAKTVGQVCKMMSRDSVPSPWGAFVSVKELNLMAGNAGAMAIKIKECISSGCGKGKECQESHPASQDNVTDALWAVEDLFQSGSKGKTIINIFMIFSFSFFLPFLIY